MSLLDLFDDEKRELKKGWKAVNEILSLQSKYENMSDDELKSQTLIFKDKLKRGATLDDILVEAFATVREVSKRVNNEFPYPVQLLAGYVIHNGDLAEAATGSGKTCSSLAPIYLNALEGKGVHVITVNEYLSARDAEHNGKVFNFLGLSVGTNLRSLTPEQKKEVYNCDITYTINSELGFDYLRDNMVTRPEKRVLRGLNFAIVDEADSILIDDSKTPLIISGGERGDVEKYLKADNFVKTLDKDDYDIDIKYKTIALNENGHKKADRFYQVNNIYDLENSDIVHYILQALKANYIMVRDVDYLIENDELILIEQSTGRKMEGREFSDGLNQAIQAKERIPIILETMTQATITYQNFFRLYNKLAGMTGTAKTEENEFLQIYNMRVIRIPTHEPVIRDDRQDRVFLSKDEKYKSLISDIVEIHKTGRPILIGTPSVEISEIVSRRLNEVKIPHEVLNAKNHAREAEIIAKAGQKNAVTVATNMAGRGTDIKLGEGVKELGGLCVLGVERHESRRIDNQLRGRAGRQGDPGSSQFYVSMEDDLMQRFGGDKMKNALKGISDLSVENKALTKTISQAQESVESMHFEARKALLEYDNVLSDQRNLIYKKRDEIMERNKAHEFVKEMLARDIKNTISRCQEGKKIDSDELHKAVALRYKIDFTETDTDKIQDEIFTKMWTDYEDFVKEIGEEFSHTERLFTLISLDREWITHIDNVSSLRDGIHYRSYAGTDPFKEYVNEAYALFDEMLDKVAERIIGYLVNNFGRKENRQD